MRLQICRPGKKEFLKNIYPSLIYGQKTAKNYPYLEGSTFLAVFWQ